jgi:hypothetical protein
MLIRRFERAHNGDIAWPLAVSAASRSVVLEGMLEGMLEEGVDLALMRGLADDRWRIKAVSEHAPQ